MWSCNHIFFAVCMHMCCDKEGVALIVVVEEEEEEEEEEATTTGRMDSTPCASQ